MKLIQIKTETIESGTIAPFAGSGSPNILSNKWEKYLIKSALHVVDHETTLSMYLKIITQQSGQSDCHHKL